MPLEAMYRCARAAPDLRRPDDGYTVHSVARQILRGYEVPADGIPTEHIPTRRGARRQKFAELLETITAND